MITIYGVTRSRAYRCLWMLEELGIPYQQEPVSFREGGTRTAEFLRINPNGHVPALRDGELVLFESLAINLYLAEKYGPEKNGAEKDGSRLWPDSVEGRGLACQWSIWAMTELEPNLYVALVNRYLLPEEQRDEKQAAQAEEALKNPLGVLSGALEGRSHLLGGDFSVADLKVASVMRWTRQGDVNLEPWPNVLQWLKSCNGRPAVKRINATA